MNNMGGVTMDYYQIGQRIRKFRRACGMSQEELAEKIGISTTHMSHIETGNTKLSLPVLVEIAVVLNVRTDEIIFENSNTSKSTYMDEISDILDTCSAQELGIISDVIKATASALKKRL